MLIQQVCLLKKTASFADTFCELLQRGGQRVSRVSMGILAAAWLFAIVSLFVAVGGIITWLKYLNFISYIKLGVTLIKYIPQVSCQ